MTERNPNHPVTQALHGEWSKLLAITMHKFRIHHIVITREDIADIAPCAIVAQEFPDGTHLRLIDEATAIELAKKEGGLPI